MSFPLKKMKEAKEQGCGGCKSVEEEIYWNHIKRICFCVTLPAEFHHKLPIPRKFAEHMRPKMIHPKVILRGPSGASWEVTLMISVDGLFLQHGWEEFVSAYSLEENDILFFKYDRNSSFDVKVFKGQCENEAAYFVKKCVHVSSAVKDLKRRASSEIVDKDDDVCIATTEKQHKNCLKTYHVKTSKKIRLVCSRKSVHLAIHYLRKKAAERSSMELQRKHSNVSAGSELAEQPDQDGLTNKEVPSVDQNPPQVTDFGTRKRLRSKKKSSPAVEDEEVCTATKKSHKRQRGDGPRTLMELQEGHSHIEPGLSKQPDQNGSTNREVLILETTSTPRKRFMPPYITFERKRPITVKKKLGALTNSALDLTDKSFSIAMRSSSCYESFFVRIPSGFASTYLGNRNHAVILRVGEKKWQTKYIFVRGGLGTGWKQFAMDNNLEESDVCLFKLVSQENDQTVLFDVTIFPSANETPRTA